MNKLLYVSAAAVALLGAACSQDEAPVKGGEGMTTFTIGLPADLGTRYGEGLQAKNLYVAIYDAENTENKVPVYTNFTGNDEDNIITQDFGTGLHAEVTVNLAKHHKYDIVFWAQSAALTAPQTDNAIYSYNPETRAIKVNYGKDNAMNAYNEDRDAFYYVANYESNGNGAQYTLTRPFAQINIGTDDIAKYMKATATQDPQFGMTITGVADLLNLTDGTASLSEGTQSISVTVAEAPTSTSTSVEGDVTNAFPAGSNMDYLAMAYVLVPSTESAPKANLGVSLNVDSKVPFFSFGTEVPAQANYRTNIYGTLLTNSEKFIIDINADWAGSFDNGILVVNTKEELADALNDPNVEAVGIASGSTIDLTAAPVALTSDKTIINSGTVELADEAGFNIAKDANVTISGTGTFNGYTNMINLEEGAEVTIDGPSFYSDCPGGVVNGSIPAKVINNPEGSTVTIKDIALDASTMGIYNEGRMVIEGGTFNCNGKGISDSDKTARGYAIYNDTGDLTINGGTFTTTDCGPTVITWTSDNWNGSRGKITINGGYFSCANGYALNIQYCKDCTINGGTFKGYGAAQIKKDSNGTINGGTFIGEGYYGLGAGIDGSGTTITIKGGNFYAANGFAAVYKGNGGTVSIKGGYFNNLQQQNAATPLWTATAGYKFVTLDPAYTLTVDGTEYAFPYQCVAE